MSEMVADKKKTCFVIMPISEIEGYCGDQAHFLHVYQEMLVPAIEKAGFKADRADLRAVSDVIMLDIIKSVLTADICICDISSRNPNVLYELGLRQAFDLPVVLIRDKKTSRIFDVQWFRDYEYDVNLHSYMIKHNIDAISERIVNTYQNWNATHHSLIKMSGVDLAKLIEDRQMMHSDEREASAGTILYYIDPYVMELESLGRDKVTIKRYKDELSLFGEYCKKKVTEIERIDYRKYIQYRKDKRPNLKATTINTIIHAHRSFFKWCIDERIVNHNPTNGLTTKIPSNKANKSLTKEEIIAIRKIELIPRDRAIFETVYSTGCTVEEVSSLMRNSIDFRTKRVVIPKKNGDTRVALLSPQAIEALLAYLSTRQDDSDALFARMRKPHGNLGHHAIQDVFANIGKKANISMKISPSCIRHTFVKALVSGGVPLEKITAMLGNMDTATTARTYSLVNDDDMEVIHRSVFGK